MAENPPLLPSCLTTRPPTQSFPGLQARSQATAYHSFPGLLARSQANAFVSNNRPATIQGRRLFKIVPNALVPRLICSLPGDCISFTNDKPGLAWLQYTSEVHSSLYFRILSGGKALKTEGYHRSHMSTSGRFIYECMQLLVPFLLSVSNLSFFEIQILSPRGGQAAGSLQHCPQWHTGRPFNGIC